MSKIHIPNFQIIFQSYVFGIRKSLIIGGVDGTRTRDPRRDRPGHQVPSNKAVVSFRIPKLRGF